MLDLGPSLAPCLALLPLLSRGAEAKRRAILAAVARRPGVGVTELAAEVGLGSGGFYAHLKAMQAEGLVTVRRRGKWCFVFPGGAAVPPRALQPPARLGVKARPLAAYLAANPGVDLSAMLERLPVERRTAYYHVRRFVRDGLLTSDAPGRYVGLRPTPKLMRLLREGRK